LKLMYGEEIAKKI
jgi:ubiquitin-like 1-activating enzyme E1 B